MTEHGSSTPKKLSKHLSPARVSKPNSVNPRSFVPPVLQEVGKLAAGVAAVATGSATGNPRNKHALQPGHSLMDWIRLGSSGKDLTGVGAQAGHLSITPRQLAQHDKPNDAWLAIRGKVFNVTHYLPFHPGGKEELMKGIGKDATTLFDEVHAWVNYESLLQKCYLGKLVAIDPDADTHELFFGKLESPNAKKMAPPKILPPHKVTPLNDTNQWKAPEEVVELKSVPKFDWIQKTDYITLIFYTGTLSNPKVEIRPPTGDNVLNINLTYNKQIFTNEIQFFKETQWPCLIKVNCETGKVEVQFRKLESKIWQTYGTLKQKTEVFSAAAEFKCKYTIVNKVEVNYNTFLLELQRVDQTKLTVPIGKHVRAFLNIQGQDLSRSYTPVPSNLYVKFKPQTLIVDKLSLMIKSYPNGLISKNICGKKKGDILEVSEPLGSFCLSSLENRETFLLLAAGTGITPMLGIVLFLLDRRIRRCKNITLLFFNRTENDILVRQQLETLQNEDNRLRVEHILSQADSKWLGVKGQISSEILRDNIEKHLLNTVYKQSDIFTLICGPNPFTNLSQSLLTNIGFSQEQIHLFLG